MKKNFDRRQFIKSSVQGLGALTLLTSPFKIFSNPTPSIQQDYSKSKADILYKQAKENFYKKDYSSAEKLYVELISKRPKDIAYYDGYAKVLGAQQKALEISELYNNGLKRNPLNPHFKHRFSLSLRKMCIGNHKAEKKYIDKYKKKDLMVLSATLLSEAISVKAIKGYMMDLRDLSVILKRDDKFSTNNTPRTVTPFINPSLIDKIETQTLSIDKKWMELRKSRKPSYSNVMLATRNANSKENKKRRILYFKEEQEARDKETKKDRKRRYLFSLNENIAKDNLYEVERYGSLILKDNIQDTDTIGKLRKYYKNKKAYNRIINLNRSIYLNDATSINALALSASLIKYAGNNADILEAKQLLETVRPYASALNSVHAACFYLSAAQIAVIEKQYQQARDILLEGLNLFGGKGGLSYSLITNYADTYINESPDKGVAIMKTLCNKDEKSIDTSLKTYLKTYLDFRKNNPISVSEQIKGLNALAKLQKITGSSEYQSTLSEIAKLKMT